VHQSEVWNITRPKECDLYVVFKEGDGMKCGLSCEDKLKEIYKIIFDYEQHHKGLVVIEIGNYKKLNRAWEKIKELVT